MVASGATLLVVPPLQLLAPAAFGRYGAAVLFEAVRVSRRHRSASAPAVAAIFPVLHVAHGVGFAAGLQAVPGSARLEQPRPRVVGPGRRLVP